MIGVPITRALRHKLVEREKVRVTKSALLGTESPFSVFSEGPLHDNSDPHFCLNTLNRFPLRGTRPRY